MQRSLLNFVLSPENVRRLDPRNTPEVEKLTLKNTEYVFGSDLVELQLTMNYLSLGIYNDEEELVGVVCLSDHPNVPSIPPWEWRHWLRNLYLIANIDPISALWIHYSVWDRRYTTLFLKVIMQSLFQNNEALDKVFMVCPPAISKLDFIDDLATRILPAGFVNPQKVQTLYLIKREDFVCHYTIRRAVEEDNDDLVAIVPEICEDTYGHYYISEILSMPEETGRQIIVAEYRGCAVGVLCLNRVVNYELLNEEFELVPYNGLKKPDDEDEVIKTHSPSVTMIPIIQDAERLSSFAVNVEVNDDTSQADLEEPDNASEDDFSLVNLSSSLILNYLYDDDESEHLPYDTDSESSIESHFSAVVLNEEYQDHLYNADKGEMGLSTVELTEKRSRKTQQEIIQIPTFHGEPNAFALEICNAVAEHENCLYTLFQAAFQCFPDKDYCVVSFPPSATSCYMMRHFARVVPRPNSVFHHELYVLHRNAILGHLAVRVAIPEDKAPVSDLLTTLIKPAIIEEQFRDAVDVQKSLYKAYVFLSEQQIIGCAIVGEEEECEYLELHYSVETWMSQRFNKFGVIGVLEQFVVSPIFQRHASLFLRELHRLSAFRVLFYRLKRYEYIYAHKNLPIQNAIGNMVPLLPNAVMEYDKRISTEYQLPNCLLKKHQPFALYMSSTRLMSMPKIEINHRIVIVGAGYTAIAFLESLLLSRNVTALVTFTNVTVVSPHGILYHKQPSKIREMVFVSNGHLDRRYMDSICLKTYVHVVTGVMTVINRKEKYVGLNDDSYLPYDYLFLLCGLQFQKPPQRKKEIVKKRLEFPQNVFIINTEADAGNAFNALKNMPTDQKGGYMVIYGHYLEACCCLAALLEFGVTGNKLVYVDPSPFHTPGTDRHDHLTQFFNNSNIETAVLDEILFQGVTIYQDFNFMEWHLDPTKNYVTSAKFESKYKFIEIELSAFFVYHSKGVSTRTFQAIIRSGLVFNGRLVIDKNYQTNDPNIYGAGSLTMYSKKYYAEHLMHKYYDGEEIGHNLGEEMRKKLIPKQYWDLPEKPPLRRKPIVQYCQFPGQLYYLQVSKSGKAIPLDVAVSKCTYGRVLTTGDCKKLDKQGYFRLHLNQYNAVETITCLAKFELSVHNLISLYGKHEILLNNLLLRYEMNMITDLFDYFNQPWACAIFHKQFPMVLEQIDQLFTSTVTSEGTRLIEEVRKMFEDNDWNPLTNNQKDEIEEICRDTTCSTVIEKKIISFLHDNYMYLPMYVHQMLIRWILHQVQASPLFVKTTFVTTERRSLAEKNPFFQNKPA